MLLLLALFLFESEADVIRFSEQVIPLYTLLLEGALPVAVLLASLRSRPSRA